METRKCQCKDASHGHAAGACKEAPMVSKNLCQGCEAKRLEAQIKAIKRG